MTRLSFSMLMKARAFRHLPVLLLRLLPRRWQLAMATAHLAMIGEEAREAVLAALLGARPSAVFENDTGVDLAAARRALITRDPPTRSMH